LYRQTSQKPTVSKCLCEILQQDFAVKRLKCSLGAVGSIEISGSTRVFVQRSEVLAQVGLSSFNVGSKAADLKLFSGLQTRLQRF